jgi:hypothetical protein
MIAPSQVIFGKDIYQELILRYRRDRSGGEGQDLHAEFEGKITNSKQSVFRFPTQVVGVRLQLNYDVVPKGPDYRIFVRDAVLITDVPWGTDHFFYCKNRVDSRKFTLPPFPPIVALKGGWCREKLESDDDHPEGRAWCAMNANGKDFTWNDYFLYGNPYPKPYAGCSVFRSLKIYSYHFRPNDNGINVRADLAFDLRFQFLWWHHPENRNVNYNISEYFSGGLILGGAYDVFLRLLAKTRPDRDCSPALEGLLATMAPAAETPAVKR